MSRIAIVILRTIGWVCAVVGAVTILGWALGLALRNTAGHDDESISRYLSPNKTRVALAVLHAGGGGLSPYCSMTVFIGRSEFDNREIINRDHRVFAGDCDTLEDNPSNVNVAWVDDHRVKIQLRMLSGTMSFNNRAEFGSIHVEFVAPQ